MAGIDRKLNPLTGDYEANATGGFVTTTTAATKLQLQIRSRLGEWWGDSEAGSLVHQIRRHNANTAGLRFADNAVRQGIRPLVDQGLIKDFDLKVSADERGRITIVGTATDAQGGQIPIGEIVPFGRDS